MMLIIDRHTSQLYARNFLRTQQAEERCKVHAYAQSWLCCMSRPQAEERRELRHRPVALRASGVVIGLVLSLLLLQLNKSSAHSIGLRDLMQLSEATP